MNKKLTLHELGIMHNCDKATYHRYCDFYQKNLPKRTAKIRILEIGLMHGASARMWRDYFVNAEIVVIDIDISRCKPIEGVTIIQMDGTDVDQLKTLGNFDLIIDDASHMTKDQRDSFNHLYYNQLNKSGFYIMEDCHTSFMPNYVNTDVTTYEVMKWLENSIEYNANDGQSISFIIKK